LVKPPKIIRFLELNAGKNRNASKLFKQSLIKPTDNSIAQVEWASQKIPDLKLDDRHLNSPLSYEARAWSFYSDAQWNEAYKECLSWLSDESFSSLPAVLATYIATVALEEYKAAESIARQSLKANPDNQSLLNNLTFALANDDKLSEAVIIYESMDPSKFHDETERIVWLATGGFLAFRRGDPQGGRLLYESAISLSKRDYYRRALALAFLAQEELRARTPDAIHIYEQAVQAKANLKAKRLVASVDAVLSRLKKTVDVLKNPRSNR